MLLNRYLFKCTRSICKYNKVSFDVRSIASMNEKEKIEIIKSIKEIEGKIKNYERLSAIELIKK